MRFTISNQTSDSLLCQFDKVTRNEYILVPPFSEIEVSPKCSTLLFAKRPHDATFKELGDIVESTSSVAVKLTMASGRKWQRLTGKGDSPWSIYRNRISRKHHALIVFPYRDTSCFLASIPNSVPLSSLMLPGTHETMAFYGWPISQCQSKPLDTQLHAGIRVLDIRLSIVDGKLIAYHGIFPEVTPFADILITLHNFLTTPATASETVVVSIKQEDSDRKSFPELVYEEIVTSPGGIEMWYLDNQIPNLGEVRGKAVMFSRFGDNSANGIHPPIWPDSAKEGFQWECDGTLVQVQDWYGIPSFLSISEKTSLATEILVSPPDSPNPTLAISFMSASSIPLALPSIIACGFGWPKWGLGFEGVNERVGKWLLDQLGADYTNWQRNWSDYGHPKCTADRTDNSRFGPFADAGPRIRGWALMDYYEDPIGAGVIQLLVECNFR
ncbi:PLC-like phosphodiesterase [Chiua virens]|nr:PLC-like phosphodiesterase [Chiua virens]